MDRRTFLQTSVISAAGAVITAKTWGIPSTVDEPLVRLTMKDVLAEMVDQTLVPMWAFEDHVQGPNIPGPMIFTKEGDRLDIFVENQLDEDHAFAIPGIVDSGPIPPGGSKRIKFRVPAAGTYIYYDNLNEPINRLMGLHGALISMPRSGNTPYSNPTMPVQMLFNHLGASEHFPGDAWNDKPGLFTDGSRTWVWVFHVVDSAKNTAVSNLPAGETMDAADFLDGFLPDYFTLNGKSGFFAACNHNISPMGNVGEPALLRVVNTGLADASPHIHGNHVYMLSENGQVQDNVIFLDTWIMRPLDRKDILLPFVRPPDIPLAAWPPVEEKFPLRYPMHDHNEISQTAAGGNYPQGLVCHWQINGPLQT